MSVTPPKKKNSMSRLQTKCVFASLTAHLLLLAALVVSSAFMKAPPKPEPVRFVKIFRDSQVTDAETQGGGNPNVPSDVIPAAAQPAIQPPAVQPNIQEPPIKLPKPVEPPSEPVKKPEPIEKKKPVVKEPVKKPETQKVVKNPNSTKIVPKQNLTEKPPEVKPDKPKIEVNLEVKKPTVDLEAQRKKQQKEREAKEEKDRKEREYQAQIRAQMDAVEQANREYKQRQQAFSGIVGALQNKMSTGVAVEMPGPGGEAFVNYADLIYTRYYQAWQTPDARDVRNPVRVEIVVARDGRVISSSIIKKSGDAQLDNSVRQALDRVSKLPAFPPGAQDAQRTFRINFELKSKRQFG